MSSPYVGEIRMFGGNFAPSGWAFCDGRLIAISENEALFALIGTFYGGDGVSTFALPDLRSRGPVHQGQGLGLSDYILGQTGGVENVTLTAAQMPAHSHLFVSTAPPVLDTPAGDVLGSPTEPSGVLAFATGGNTGLLNANGNAPAGGSQPHSNIMPYLATSFIISLFGVFPSRN